MPVSDVEALGPEAQAMGLDPLGAGGLAVLHDALVPQPLGVRAGAADPLLGLRIDGGSCGGGALAVLGVRRQLGDRRQPLGEDPNVGFHLQESDSKGFASSADGSTRNDRP